MQRVLQSITNLIIEKLSANCNDITTQEDFERAIERLCEVATQIGISNIDIGKQIPCIDEIRLDAIIRSLKNEKSFRVSKEHTPEEHILARWDLEKYNSNNSLCIELLEENCIHICGPDWNMVAYGYNTLKSAILGWVKNRM